MPIFPSRGFRRRPRPRPMTRMRAAKPGKAVETVALDNPAASAKAPPPARQFNPLDYARALKAAAAAKAASAAQAKEDGARQLRTASMTKPAKRQESLRPRKPPCAKRRTRSRTRAGPPPRQKAKSPSRKRPRGRAPPKRSLPQPKPRRRKRAARKRPGIRTWRLRKSHQGRRRRGGSRRRSRQGRNDAP